MYCSVIAEVIKHFKNMLQQALGPKVFRLLLFIKLSLVIIFINFLVKDFNYKLIVQTLEKHV